MKTILKWPGGKERELPIIREYTPEYSGRYVEPFVGGGAVFFDTENKECCINDKSTELINLYMCIKEGNEDLKQSLYTFDNDLNEISDFIDSNRESVLSLYLGQTSTDDFIDANSSLFNNIALLNQAVFNKELKRNLKSKIKRSAKLESENGAIPDTDRIDNIEAAIKSAYYMYVRYLLNNENQLSKGLQAAVFFYIREYCYSSMFRYNANGEFNVPYGGISYNRKDLKKKIDYLFSDEMSKKLSDTLICCCDFEDFINKLNLTENDYIFLDPPYDSDFSTYAQNVFDRDEQIRLNKCLKKTKAKFQLIIKNTEFIYGLYKDDFNILSFDKNYSVSFMNRNDRSAEHLIITNYPIDGVAQQQLFNLFSPAS